MVESKRKLIRGADVFAMITSIVKSSSQRESYFKLTEDQARRAVRVEYSGEAEDSPGKNRRESRELTKNTIHRSFKDHYPRKNGEGRNTKIAVLVGTL